MTAFLDAFPRAEQQSNLLAFCGEEFYEGMKAAEPGDAAYIITERLKAMNNRDWSWRYVRDGVYTAMSQPLKETERRIRRKVAVRSKPKVKAAPKTAEQIAAEKEAKLARSARLGSFGMLGSRGDKRGKPCKDHLGNKYPSIKAMCDAYGIRSELFYVKRKEGHSVESILTRNVPRTNIYVYKDHLGNEFTSQRAMCEYWGVSYGSYAGALKKGMSLKEFLTRKPIAPHTGRRMSCKDHLGNEWPSVKAMCEAYGANPKTFRKLLRRGKTLEDILTHRPMRDTTCIDHTGRVHSSIAEMCRYWGVTCSQYQYRIKHGGSLEEALTAK